MRHVQLTSAAEARVGHRPIIAVFLSASSASGSLVGRGHAADRFFDGCEGHSFRRRIVFKNTSGTKQDRCCRRVERLM